MQYRHNTVRSLLILEIFVFMLLLKRCLEMFDLLTRKKLYKREVCKDQKINLPTISLRLMALLSRWTGINFLPTRLRSNATWSIAGLEIRILEFLSTSKCFGSSLLLLPWVRLMDDPWTELNPIGFLPMSGNFRLTPAKMRWAENNETSEPSGLYLK